MKPQVCKPKPCKGCGESFSPTTFRVRYCETCRGKCKVDGCSSAVKAHGYCGMHLWRFTEHGEAGDAKYLHVPQAGECSVVGCSKPAKTKGYCHTHDYRVRKHGHPGSPKTRLTKKTGVPCEVEGCTKISCGDGLCRMHYERRRNTGDLGPPHPVRRAVGEGSFNNGYRVITVNGRAVLEHRHVMGQILGRPLLEHENVHHVSGERSNNDPVNLELWSTSQPAGQRIPDKVAWAEQIIELYKDHVPNIQNAVLECGC